MEYMPKFRAEERDDGSIVSDYQIADIIKIFGEEAIPAERIRVRDTMRWIAPSVHILDSKGGLRDSTEDLIDAPSAHILTPESETTTHYFWSSACAKDFPIPDEALIEVLIQAFDHEDKPMLKRFNTVWEPATCGIWIQSSCRPMRRCSNAPQARCIDRARTRKIDGVGLAAATGIGTLAAFRFDVLAGAGSHSVAALPLLLALAPFAGTGYSLVTWRSRLSPFGGRAGATLRSVLISSSESIGELA